MSDTPTPLPTPKRKRGRLPGFVSPFKKERRMCQREGCPNRVKSTRATYCGARCASLRNRRFGAHSPESDARRKAKTVKLKKAFLVAFKEKGTMSVAAKIAGIHTTTVKTWRKEDEKFAADFEASVEHVADVVEAGLIDRAVHGVPIPIFYQGKQCGERREFDTRAAEIFLKGRRPSVFNERIVTHQNANGAPLAATLNSIQILVRDPTNIAVLEEQRALPYETVRERVKRHTARKRGELTGD